jgi:hypothetical protein
VAGISSADVGEGPLKAAAVTGLAQFVAAVTPHIGHLIK